ncbi:MAG: hypothetical protein IGS03_03275 [Candidatus Sericytochromatia bacterium]|nr:hypothetical protein [Candidatus Sericytochromatia bacterium]
MALRIIRKSASQSQVELIRGKSEQAPAASLLIYIDSEAQLQAAKSLLAAQWIQDDVECLLMKSSALDEPLRPHFNAQGQTIKLLNEPRDASWSLRLRTLIQEASAECCLFLPHLPASVDLMEVLKTLASALPTDPNLALLGPALVHDGQVLAAGQDLAVNFARHQLLTEDSAYSLEFDQQRLFYFYQGLPLALWQRLAGERLLSAAGVPLNVAAIRRSAYLSLAWQDQDFELPWLAQELSFALRQAQYTLAISGLTLNLSDSEAETLKSSVAPQNLMDTWQPLRKNTLYPLYLQHGLIPQGQDFALPLQPKPKSDPVAAYIAERSSQA